MTADWFQEMPFIFTMDSGEGLLKRPRSRSRDISPPPLRKRRFRTSLSPSSTNPSRKEPNEIHDGKAFRIFAWNINGIAPLLQPTILSPSIPPLAAFLCRHSFPQILLLQEVKISPKDQATQRSLSRAVDGTKQTTPPYTVHLSLPRDKHNARGFGGKLYGVATLIRSDFSTRGDFSTRDVDWDLEGRVLVSISEKLKIAVVNVYAVNGTDNPYKSPGTGVVSGTRHEHKRRFHRHLLNECLKLEKKGLGVVIGGDLNISLSELDGYPGIRLGSQHVANRADFNRKFLDDEAGLTGIDAFRHLHGEKKKYSYYPRGRTWGESCDRVDMFIVSRTLVYERRALQGAEILDSELERGPSDHVPLNISLDLRALGPDEGLLRTWERS